MYLLSSPRPSSPSLLFHKYLYLDILLFLFYLVIIFVAVFYLILGRLGELQGSSASVTCYMTWPDVLFIV